MSVELEDVTIRYGNFVAVDSVSASFPAGAVGLLGRNGAGKSSILKALLGLVRPTCGELRVLGRSARVDPAGIRVLVGYMPERDGYLPGLNGYEAVCLLARLSGMDAATAARRAHEVLWLVDLGEQRYRKVSGYSTGMRQKVKLAAAMVHDPAVLFLDEPTNGLDPDGRREMLETVEYLAGDLGKSIILSSHILQDVERVCRKVVVLDQGRVVADGPISELTRDVGRVFAMEVGGDPLSIVASLGAQAGIVRVDRPEPEHPGRLSVELAPSLPVSALFQAVLAAGGVVQSLVERRRSLEEVFLGAVAPAWLTPSVTAKGGA